MFVSYIFSLFFFHLPSILYPSTSLTISTILISFLLFLCLPLPPPSSSPSSQLLSSPSSASDSLSSQVQCLTRALETKRTFVRHVSHEIRTPLNTVSAALQFLREFEHTHEWDHAVKTEMLEICQEASHSCEAAVTILNDLLMYEKLDGGLLKLELAEEEVFGFMREVISPFKVQARAQGVGLIMKLDPRLEILQRMNRERDQKDQKDNDMDKNKEKEKGQGSRSGEYSARVLDEKFIGNRPNPRPTKNPPLPSPNRSLLPPLRLSPKPSSPSTPPPPRSTSSLHCPSSSTPSASDFPPICQLAEQQAQSHPQQLNPPPNNTSNPSSPTSTSHSPLPTALQTVPFFSASNTFSDALSNPPTSFPVPSHQPLSLTNLDTPPSTTSSSSSSPQPHPQPHPQPIRAFTSPQHTPSPPPLNSSRLISSSLHVPSSTSSDSSPPLIPSLPNSGSDLIPSLLHANQQLWNTQPSPSPVVSLPFPQQLKHSLSPSNPSPSNPSPSAPLSGRPPSSRPSPLPTSQSPPNSSSGLSARSRNSFLASFFPPSSSPSGDSSPATSLCTSPSSLTPQLTFSIDKVKFSQVIRNLVSNALKFSPPASTVKIFISLHDYQPPTPQTQPQPPPPPCTNSMHSTNQTSTTSHSTPSTSTSILERQNSILSSVLSAVSSSFLPSNPSSATTSLPTIPPSPIPSPRSSFHSLTSILKSSHIQIHPPLSNPSSTSSSVPRSPSSDTYSSRFASFPSLSKCDIEQGTLTSNGLIRPSPTPPSLSQPSALNKILEESGVPSQSLSLSLSPSRSMVHNRHLPMIQRTGEGDSLPTHSMSPYSKPTNQSPAPCPSSHPSSNQQPNSKSFLLRFSISDSGPGLSPENQAKLFKEMVQFNPNQLQKGGGSGFGLFISKGIVDLHEGGKIRVESLGEGKGATFIVEIPTTLSLTTPPPAPFLSQMPLNCVHPMNSLLSTLDQIPETSFSLHPNHTPNTYSPHSSDHQHSSSPNHHHRSASTSSSLFSSLYSLLWGGSRERDLHPSSSSSSSSYLPSEHKYKPKSSRTATKKHSTRPVKPKNPFKTRPVSLSTLDSSQLALHNRQQRRLDQKSMSSPSLPHHPSIPYPDIPSSSQDSQSSSLFPTLSLHLPSFFSQHRFSPSPSLSSSHSASESSLTPRSTSISLPQAHPHPSHQNTSSSNPQPLNQHHPSSMSSLANRRRRASEFLLFQEHSDPEILASEGLIRNSFSTLNTITPSPSTHPSHDPSIFVSALPNPPLPSISSEPNSVESSFSSNPSSANQSPSLSPSVDTHLSFEDFATLSFSTSLPSVADPSHQFPSTACVQHHSYDSTPFVLTSYHLEQQQREEGQSYLLPPPSHSNSAQSHESQPRHPMSLSSGQTTDPPPSSAPPSLSPHVVHVLVVDDAPSNRKVLIRLLEKLDGTRVPVPEPDAIYDPPSNGHHTQTQLVPSPPLSMVLSQAPDGDLAVKLVGRSLSGEDAPCIDIVLMDYQMPNLDGPSAARLMREMGFEGLIVGITGNVQSEDIRVFKDHGANDVIGKPINLAELKKLVLNHYSAVLYPQLIFSSFS